MLYPIQNETRNKLDLSGIWAFQPDPQEVGERNVWFHGLETPRPIAVPGSWNDLYEDLHNYLGLSWYVKRTFIPNTWQGQRVFLRVGSANYAATVYVNGEKVGAHQGGHLPFAFDITQTIKWHQENLIAISVDNKQLPERVPPGPSAGAAGVMSGFPMTTYDFFPYAGLHRPVMLYSVPAAEHIDDVTVVTTIDGKDGIVEVTVATSGEYSGTGKARLNSVEVDLSFNAGSAQATLCVPSAQFWSPQSPHLYPLTVRLTQGERITDSYTLDIGIRTVAVRGDQLLLNGQPIKLVGFGKHEDFPLSGRGLNLPVWIRDYELLKWIGANSFRTSHYPYAEEAMQLADQLGIMVINEIPAVGLNFADAEPLIAQRLAQCQQQLGELIGRDKNHPSTIMWSVANEPVVGLLPGMASPAPKAVEAGMSFFRQMYALAHQLDGTRPVTLVGMQGSPRDWHGIFDMVCVNAYYGWYTQPGQLDEGVQALANMLDDLYKTFAKPIMITECGADTLAGAHSTPPEMWTEEYQVEFLQRYLDIVAQRPFMVGMHVWCFADFKTGQSIIRPTGRNHKGVFTRTRQPKMAAHMLRSMWKK
jgi:beta-glucuronidase